MDRCTVGCPPWFPCIGCACMIPRHSEETERERSYKVDTQVSGKASAFPPYKEKKYTQLTLEL